MSGYTKNIAVIKQLKEGFSADATPLSGLVKSETYGGWLKVEISKINFAPLTEGRYVSGISDGKKTLILDGDVFDGRSDLDTAKGFAALICFVNGTVCPIATAVCGNLSSAAFAIREEIEKSEKLQTKRNESAYDDNAIAEENYYEFEQTFKNGNPVREGEAKEAAGAQAFGNEADFGSGEKSTLADGGGVFYERMKPEIEKLFSTYPRCEDLEEVVDDSRWVKINYGVGRFYVFGVIYAEGKPKFVCYGVPSKNAEYPPTSMKNLASFVPSKQKGEGYWVSFQDANSGAAIKIEAK